MKKYLLFTLLSFFFTRALWAETIELKSGAFFEGTIIEKTDSFIKLDTKTRVLMIKLSDIENIISPTPQEPKIPANDLDQSTENKEPIKLDAGLIETPPIEPVTPKEINPDDLTAEENCPNLSANLENCTPYKCEIKDPFVKDFISEHTIYGERNNNCLWKQTLVEEGLMRCRLSEDSREKIAADLKSNLHNSPALDEAFTNGECRISGYEKK